ncbi:MAG: hypothetical protein J5676_06050 [Bacteroidaceae bacterium]|nr:hypothetical protein [Bacteroidaceae bacterium]
MTKIKSAILSILLVLAFVPAAAQNYESMWKKVYNLQKKDRTASVNNSIDDIYNVAKKKGNELQMCKAIALKGDNYVIFTEDSTFECLTKMKSLINNTKNDTLKLFAQVFYMRLCDNVGWSPGRDNDVVDFSWPYEKWTLKMFDIEREKVLNEILATAGKYAGVSNKRYRDIIKVSDDDLPFNHDILSTVCLSIINADSCVYKLMLDEYSKNENFVDAEIWSFVKYAEEKEYKECISLLEKAMQNEKYKRAKLYPEIYLSLIDKLKSDCPERALALCDEAIARFTGYRRYKEFLGHKRELLYPNLSIRLSSDVLYPNDSEGKIFVEWKNLDGFKLNWYKVDTDNIPKYDLMLLLTNPESWYRLKGHDRKMSTGKKISKLYKTETFSLKEKNRLKRSDSLVFCKVPDCGIYFVECVPVEDSEDFNKDYIAEEQDLHVVYVSALSVLTDDLTSGKRRFYVLDSKTGHIAEGAELVFFEEDSLSKVGEENGAFIVQNSDGEKVRAVKGDDKYMPFSILGSRYITASRVTKSRLNASLFTDRALYRPSQTVHAGGFVYREQGDIVNAVENENLTVVMKDGSKVLQKVSVKTDSYGGYSADLALPASVSKNKVVLMVEDGNANRLVVKDVAVEEYKLPEFRVEIDSLKGNYTWGDSVMFSGKAVTFSGMPVANAKVYTTFNNTQRDSLWTDEAGRFALMVKLPEEGSMIYYRYLHSNYTFSAAVTSESGETESDQMRICISNLPVIMSISFPDVVLNDASEELKFDVCNNMGINLNVQVKYNIYKAQKKDGKQDKVGEALLSGTFQSNIGFQPMDIYSLESGRYTIEAICYDTIKVEKQFVLFSLYDKRPADDSELWTYAPKYFDTDNSVSIQVGTSFKDAWIFADAYSENKLIDSRIIKCDNSNETITYKYLPEYGDGIVVDFFVVRNGKSYEKHAGVRVPKPDKKLNLKWHTFRDRLVPGQKEIWRLSVSKADGTPADAQVLATMYDGALDLLRPHSLNFEYKSSWKSPYSSFWLYYKGNSGEWIERDFDMNGSYFVGDYGYDVLCTFDLVSASGGLAVTDVLCVEEDVDYEKGPLSVKSKSYAALRTAKLEKENTRVAFFGEEASDNATSTVTPRTNLSETAFFYPALQTDKDGIATISFTLPEGLTTWKFKAVAHTRQLENGTIDSDAVAQKTIMIKPQMPRFLRKGDKAQITAMLYNNNGKSVGGTAFITIFDPLTEEVIVSKKQSVSLKANGSSSVTFAFDAPTEDKLYACKMIVETSLGSDGEQQYLPVLPDETLLTESQPFMWKDKGAHEESLDSLFSGQKSVNGKYAMTVQYSANPVWYAVQALPSLCKADSHTALGAMLGYYSSSLARHIANSNPKIKSVVDVWKQDKTGKSLISALKMNADLKEIPLEESLWEDVANDETVRKQQISDLFDENKTNLALERSIDKLKTFQNADGGFAWCHGFKFSSYFETSEILRSFANLLQLRTSEQITPVEKEIITKALAFMDKEIADELKQKFCSVEMMLQYYHIRTMLSSHVGIDREASASIKKIESKFGGFLKEPGLLSMYGRAVLSSALVQNGRKKEAEDLCISLLENTVSRKQSGRYFEGRMNFWGGNMKMDCHTYVIEALSEWLKRDASAATRTLPDGTTYAEALAQMRVWLLNQKRTNNWDNPMESVNAVYALMCNENADLSVGITGNRLTVCGHEIDMKSEIAAIGFCNDKWIAESTDNAKLTLDKSTDGISWGAVYAQYKVKDSDVKQKGEELRIEREYFVERNVNGKVQNIPLRDTKLAVGDKLVQHIYLVAMTDLDYIQIEVPRAACAEPANKLSGYRRSGSIGFYESVKDTKSQIFIAHLPKGRHAIDTTMFIDRKGTYSTGVATVRCAYDSAYGAHTTSAVLQVR